MTATCTHCGVVLTIANRINDPDVDVVLEHLWDAHPRIVERPHTLHYQALLAHFTVEQ